MLQDTVTFSNHRFAGSSASAADTCRELKIRAFDYLIELVLKQIVNAREKRVDLERQRQLMQRKLESMQTGNWGLEPLLTGEKKSGPDYHQLEQDIKAVEAELMILPEPSQTMERRFDRIKAIFDQPKDWLDLRHLHPHIDSMLVKVKDAVGSDSRPLELIEFFSSSGDRRILLPGYFPRDELPPRRDFLKEANRYLG